MTHLELLAPAKNAQIGIAAIDCGADAVYIAGPSFGARQAAGNSVGDIAELCRYASRYGVRVYATVNTILYDEELPEAKDLLVKLQEAGVSAFIVQDLAIVRLAREAGITVPLHASTQCSIRTPERAAFFESLGFSRLVLEREMSLDRIREIRSSVDAELEFFVHGALCVCYSGQCYLSEYLVGRSANRGACAQACRSRYDLVDASGRVLVKDKALLSLKDYNLLSRIGDLASSGVCSFKIEGRLKNISYVRNVVGAYSSALDRLVAENSEKYARASFGRAPKAFTPDLRKTFNRDYTELFIDGKRGSSWSSMDIPKGAGEYIGTVKSVRPDGRADMTVAVDFGGRNVSLANGDGFAYLSGGEIIGFRGDVCSGNTIRTSMNRSLRSGMKLYRNLSVLFEKTLENLPPREIRVVADIRIADGEMTVSAKTEDGRECTVRQICPSEVARERGRMEAMIMTQMSKRSEGFLFEVGHTYFSEELPFLSASFLNSVRRRIASELSSIPCNAVPIRNLRPGDSLTEIPEKDITYKSNISNAMASSVVSACGAASVEPAYELSHLKGAELMRTKYCIRYELGMCPKHQKAKPSGPLFLVNNGRRLALGFDCAACEMIVSDGV